MAGGGLAENPELWDVWTRIRTFCLVPKDVVPPGRPRASRGRGSWWREQEEPKRQTKQLNTVILPNESIF